jgi:hypothetical protein
MPVIGQAAAGTVHAANMAATTPAPSAPAFNPKTDDYKSQYKTFGEAFNAARTKDKVTQFI